MSKVTNTTGEVGVIGQMYESRRSNKVGVLESRDTKYKTLLMRDPEGSSFNVTFSTFRSDWRKYSGEVVAKTSTQIEEERKEDSEHIEESKSNVSETAKRVKLTTEEKVIRLKSIEDIVSKIAEDKKSGLKVSMKAKGGILVAYKRRTLFEVWDKFKLNKIEVPVRDCVIEADTDCIAKLKSVSEYVYMESWVLKHCFKADSDKLTDVVSSVIDSCIKYVELKENTQNNTTEEDGGENE